MRHMDGICTLANDVVYEQVIALINSIEAIAGKDLPICIYPYDERVAKLTDAIKERPNVQLYSDRASIASWDKFARDVWQAHPTAHQLWQQQQSKNDQNYDYGGTHRRYCAFDGPFKRFLYMDANTLLMNGVKPIFNLLEHYDCVVYDFQYKDPTGVYQVDSLKLETIFDDLRIAQEICTGSFYAAHQNLFNASQRETLLNYLQDREAEILYPFAPARTLINYMLMRTQCSILNLALSLPPEQVTECRISANRFLDSDNILYERGKRLTYIHYNSLPSSLFRQVCSGENIDFPYRDLFLHYRYLHEPEKQPHFITRAKPYDRSPSITEKVISKLGFISTQKLG